MRRLHGICIITDDVPRLSQFYRDLLQVESEGEGDFAALAVEGASLTLFSAAGMERMAGGSMAGLARGRHVIEFEVDDVDREHHRLVRMGVPVVKEPETHPWGLRSVWFRDPDGNIVDYWMRVGS